MNYEEINKTVDLIKTLNKALEIYTDMDNEIYAYVGSDNDGSIEIDYLLNCILCSLAGSDDLEETPVASEL